MAATVGELGEEGVIALFSGRAPDAGPARDADLGDNLDARGGGTLVIPNGDDAAAWRQAPGEASVITTDTMVEGQHFDFSYTPARSVGRKLMAVNLSDLAAMGARPQYALLSVCFDKRTPVAAVRDIAEGVLETSAAHAVEIIGGNVTGIRGPAVLTATLVGRAPPQALLRRRGARPGDAIFVTGCLGDAAAGLRLALAGRRPAADEPDAALLAALVEPTPRVEAGLRLGQTGRVRAMCDLSDGFGRDLRRLLDSGRLGACIDAERLPISSTFRAWAHREGLAPAAAAAAGGEDYELLVIAAPGDEPQLVEACRAAGTNLTRVGAVTDRPAVELVYPDGRTATVPTGFEHFEGTS